MKYREKKSTVKSKFRQHVALQLVGNITFQHFWPVRGSQAMFVQLDKNMLPISDVERLHH